MEYTNSYHQSHLFKSSRDSLEKQLFCNIFLWRKIFFKMKFDPPPALRTSKYCRRHFYDNSTVFSTEIIENDRKLWNYNWTSVVVSYNVTYLQIILRFCWRFPMSYGNFGFEHVFPMKILHASLRFWLIFHHWYLIGEYFDVWAIIVDFFHEVRN